MDRCGEPLSSGVVAAWRAVMCAHAELSRALEEALESQSDLPLLAYEVLARLAEAPGRRLRMQELTEQLPLTKSGLTRLIDRMERAGLARREVCPADRRGTFTAITDKGREVLERANEVHLRVLHDRLTRLEEEELAALLSACAKIAAAQRLKSGGS